MARDGGAPTATVEDCPEETPAAAGDLTVDAETVRNQLREKEHLVAALTERLEQAAEQLDRLRRTGVDKGRRPLGGGFPAEVIDDHKHTLEDLKRVITNWEDIQAGATLGRIETQIMELRELIVGAGPGSVPTAGFAACAAQFTSPLHLHPARRLPHLRRASARRTFRRRAPEENRETTRGGKRKKRP